MVHLSEVHAAANVGDVARVTARLAAGNDANQQREIKRTPLHTATVKGHVNVVMALLEHVADTEVSDGRGMTRLHYAAVVDLKIVEALIENGADVHAKTEDSHTALHWAAY
mmetsp:Transcript_30289/g.79515  ORF Transcript_30289/g.79515 Transcript_30289/m.79515 type:complete len:111 (+) Transcript_30289:77-409(+)